MEKFEPKSNLSSENKTEKINPYYKEFRIENIKPLYKTGTTDYNRLTEIESELADLHGVKEATLQGNLLGIDIEESADWNEVILQVTKIIETVLNKKIEIKETEHKGEPSKNISRRKGRDEEDFIEEEFGDEIKRLDEKE